MQDSGKRGDLEFTSIAHLTDVAAERYGWEHAIADGDVVLSFRDLRDRADAAARSLIALGVESGDRVAVWAPNVWEWIVVALGAHRAGAAIVTVNTRYKGDEAAYLLAKSGARVLATVHGFLGNDYVGMLRGCGDKLPALQHVIVMRGAAPDGTLDFTAFMSRGDGVGAAAAVRRAAAVGPGDLADLMFTSGTTGRPKGVMATHAQNLRCFRDWADVVGLRRGDRYLIVNPFFHTFGYKAGWLACLMTGATAVLQAVFDPDEVLARIARERISVLPGPPTLYQSLLAHPDLGRCDRGSLRLAVTGAAMIPVELVRRMRDVLGFADVVTAYGLTEATGVVTMCRRDDDAETIAQTSGRAAPGVEVRIVGDDGRGLPAGEVGEIVVRGYNVMQGYFEEPEQTRQAVDAGGWLHTGDVGTLDARGCLRITDRKKDMFIVGGFNAYPAEIERMLLQHEAVAQCAVVGMPDARLGEVGAAFVVLKPGAAADAGSLIAWCRERMANYKVPRRMEFVSTLPLNATGKVLKFELRARVNGR